MDIITKLRPMTAVQWLGGRSDRVKIASEAIAEIEALRSDIALLGPVTTPVSGELCSSCIEPMVAHWTYCPYCGAQGRLNAAGEKI